MIVCSLHFYMFWTVTDDTASCRGYKYYKSCHVLGQ